MAKHGIYITARVDRPTRGFNSVLTCWENGRRLWSDVIRTAFICKTDALDYGYVYARQSTPSAKVHHPYTRAAWAPTWQQVAP
jgi:hypothetical protein